MTKKSGNEVKDTPGRALRDAVLTETTRLMEQMRFTTGRGAFAEGRHASVMVDSPPGENGKTFNLFITCHPHQPVRLACDGLPVFVTPRHGGSDRCWITFLDSHGQAWLTDLPAGEYRLNSSTCFGPREPTGPLWIHAPALAAKSLMPQPTRQPEFDQWARIVESNDGRVRATVRLTPHGSIALAIETGDVALAKGWVNYALVSPTGAVTQHGTLVLEEVSGRTPLWEGRTEWRVSGQQACGLVFAVQPPSIQRMRQGPD